MGTIGFYKYTKDTGNHEADIYVKYPQMFASVIKLEEKEDVYG